MSKAEKTEWMNSKVFVQYLDEEKIQAPMYGWKMVELLRMHSAKKYVMEQGHPIPHNGFPVHVNDRPGREIVRYTFRKRVTDSIVGGVCLFQVTKKQLSP